MLVNTGFFCPCSLDLAASVTPCWRPPCESALEPTGRCHLNGLAMVEGRPRYASRCISGSGVSPGEAETVDSVTVLRGDRYTLRRADVRRVLEKGPAPQDTKEVSIYRS